MYRAVVLIMALLNEELQKMKKLFQNLQIFRGSCLSKSRREAGLALVTWKFVTFPSSAALLLGLQAHSVNTTDVCVHCFSADYVYALSVP